MAEGLICETVADLEKYIIEIVSRLRSLQSKCNNYLSINFISDHPVSLAKIIGHLCDYFQQSLFELYKTLKKRENNSEEDIQANFNIIQTIDNMSKLFAEELQFVDGAIPQNLPWSIIKPLENLLSNMVPDISFMLRPQWEYNYSIINSDIREVYMNRISQLKKLYNIPFEYFKTEFTKTFHIISFPYIEKSNVLLHAMIGHELGHLLINENEFVNEKEIDKLVYSVYPKIKTISKDQVDSVYSTQTKEPPNIFVQTEYMRRFKFNIRFTASLIKRGLEELLSDIIGTLIFGPAMLFSIYEIAIQSNLDEIPSEDNNFYPPWRCRLRETLKIVQRKNSEFFPISEEIIKLKELETKVNNHFNRIEKLVEIPIDIDKINSKSQIHKIAYEQIMVSIQQLKISTKNFSKILKTNIIKPGVLYKNIENLLERYENKLPPNAVEKSFDDKQTASIIEIVNTGWFYKISMEQNLLNVDSSVNQELFELRDALNRLTLKGIEYSFVESKYNEHRKK